VNGSFFDTSVLLSGLIDLGEATAESQALFDAIAAGKLASLHTAWHCCLEFYAVATRLPREFRLSPAEAKLLLQEEILARFTVNQLPAKQLQALVETAGDHGVAGGAIYDFHIAEVARSSGVERVVTHNRRHFLSLLRHGIQVMTAGELVAELGL
jgi:predicted nucleic acid-binding protein